MGKWCSGFRLGRGGRSAKLRFLLKLCSGVRCQREGFFQGGELQVQPSVHASESRYAGGGDISVLSFAGGANR